MINVGVIIHRYIDIRRACSSWNIRFTYCELYGKENYSHLISMSCFMFENTVHVLRPVHTSKFKRIRCASNANWSRSHCALSDAHQLNAHSMRIESIHFKMWFQRASNRIAWAIPEVMNNELIPALERWLLGRRHDLTIFIEAPVLGYWQCFWTISAVVGAV